MENNIDFEPDSAVVARHTSQWARLSLGQKVSVREAGHPSAAAVVEDVTPDGSVLWVWVNGMSPRRMFLAGDPVEILAWRETPKAF